MKGLDYQQYYFLSVTSPKITSDEINNILYYVMEIPNDIAKYDDKNKIIEFSFKGSQYINLEDYILALKYKLLPFCLNTFCKIIIAILNSWKMYNQNNITVDFHLYKLWIYSKESFSNPSQISQVRVYLISALIFFDDEKKQNMKQYSLQYFFNLLQQTLQNFSLPLEFQPQMKKLIYAFSSQNFDFIMENSNNINLQVKTINTSVLPQNEFYENLKTLFYGIFKYFTKFGTILRDNLINWVVKQKNFSLINLKDFGEFLAFNQLSNILELFVFQKKNRMEIEEVDIITYFAKNGHLNSLYQLQQFKFQEFYQTIKEQQKIQQYQKQQEKQQLLSEITSHYKDILPLLDGLELQQLQQLKDINEQALGVIETKIIQEFRPFSQALNEIYKLNEEQSKIEIELLQKQVLQNILREINGCLYQRQITFYKLQDVTFLKGLLDQSLVQILMAYIEQKNKDIVEHLLFKAETQQTEIK